MTFEIGKALWSIIRSKDPTSLLALCETLNILYKKLVIESGEILPKRQVSPKPNPFLSHTPSTAEHRYSKEKQIYPGLLYTELVCYIDRLITGKGASIEIKPEPGLFHLAPLSNPEVEALRDSGFAAFKHAGKYRYESDVIRLNGFDDDGQKTTLTIQKAKYSQQARSNLILDYEARPGGPTMRKALMDERRGFLPDLRDKRLAQTIGVSMLLFYPDQGEWMPFLVARNRETAVLNEGEWSDSASGAAEWPADEHNTAKTFEAYILDDMYMELDEELGLKPQDLSNVLPLAIAREFIRAGKPQIFFIGFTNLSYNDIVMRMEERRKETLKNPNLPNEINKMPAFRRIPRVSSAKEAAKSFQDMRIDPQSAASLYYAHRFFEALSKHPS